MLPPSFEESIVYFPVGISQNFEGIYDFDFFADLGSDQSSKDLGGRVHSMRICAQASFDVQGAPDVRTRLTVYVLSFGLKSRSREVVGYIQDGQGMSGEKSRLGWGWHAKRSEWMWPTS